jgi:hypothetical protein
MVEELDHVAIAVRDLEAWTQRFEVMLGRPVSFHGRIPEDHVLTAQFHLGKTMIELISPSAEQGAVARRLRDAGEGVYLIAVRPSEGRRRCDDPAHAARRARARLTGRRAHLVDRVLPEAPVRQTRTRSADKRNARSRTFGRAFESPIFRFDRALVATREEAMFTGRVQVAALASSLVLSQLGIGCCIAHAKGTEYEGKEAALCDAHGAVDRADALMAMNRCDDGSASQRPFLLRCIIKNVEQVSNEIEDFCRSREKVTADAARVLLSSSYTRLSQDCTRNAMQAAFAVSADRPVEERRAAFAPLQEALCWNPRLTADRAREFYAGPLTADWISSEQRQCLRSRSAEFVRDFEQSCHRDWASAVDSGTALMEWLASCGVATHVEDHTLARLAGLESPSAD